LSKPNRCFSASTAVGEVIMCGLAKYVIGLPGIKRGIAKLMHVTAKRVMAV